MSESKKKITATLVLVIGLFVAGNLIPQNTPQAQAATAKKTVKITVDEKHPDKSVSLITKPKMPKSSIWKKPYSFYKKYFNKNGIYIKIEILKLKGKPKGKIIDFEHACADGTGALILEMPAKKFKKGIIYKRNRPCCLCSTYMNIGLPKGVKKVTYKITFASASGKRALKKVIVKNKYVDPVEWDKKIMG